MTTGTTAAPDLTVARPSGRAPGQLREVRIQRGYTRHAEGSVLISFANTRVLCTPASRTACPAFPARKGEAGPAEYGMLPRATHTRSDREPHAAKQAGARWRSAPDGRSLRACIDRKALGERTITLDCTSCRPTAAPAPRRHRRVRGAGRRSAVADQACENQTRSDLRCDRRVSVGIYRGVPVVDLDYAEHSDCDNTDMNVVMNDGGGFIELQVTAEGPAFRREELAAMTALAEAGIAELVSKHTRGAGG